MAQPYNPLEGDRPELTLNLHDGTEEQVSIVVVHKDRPEYLNLCLQSIAVASFNNNYEIIVSDNNSGKETQDFLDEIQHEVKVVRNRENLYWAGAANRGAQAADPNSKYLIFLHCDVVILNPAWIDLLASVSEGHHAGMVGLELQNYKIHGKDVGYVQEWCCLMSRECWKDAGPWPEELPQLGSSFIFTLRAQQRGWKPQVMKNNICHHYRIFSVDPNEWEVIVDTAMSRIPKLMRDIQVRTSAV